MSIKTSSSCDTSQVLLLFLSYILEKKQSTTDQKKEVRIEYMKQMFSHNHRLDSESSCAMKP